MCEGIRTPETDTLEEDLRLFLITTEERNHPGTDILISESGITLSPENMNDKGAEYSPNGLIAAARIPTQVALGHPLGSDHILKRVPVLAFTDGSGWEGLDVEMESQLYYGPREAASMTAATFSAGQPTWSNDGHSIAFVEWLGWSPEGVEGSSYRLWEVGVDGSRRAITDLKANCDWSNARLAYSPDDEWLLMSTGHEIQGPRLVYRSSGQSFDLPSRFQAAAWNYSAGASRIVAVTPSSSDLEIVDFDLSTNRADRLGRVSAPTSSPLYFVEADLSSNGQHLLGLAPLGYESERMERIGVAPKTAVIDLTTLTISMMMSPDFGTGAERSHASPRWAQRPRAAGSVQIAEQLMKTVRPAMSSELYGEQLEHHRQRFRACTGGCLAAIADRGIPVRNLWTELLRFAAAAASVEPEFGVQLHTEVGQFCFDRYRHLYFTANDPSADEWLSLAANLQRIRECGDVEWHYAAQASSSTSEQHQDPPSALPPIVANRYRSRRLVAPPAFAANSLLTPRPRRRHSPRPRRAHTRG